MRHRIILVLAMVALALAGAVPAHGTVATVPVARPLSRIHIAFTQNNNVYIMNANGSGRVTVTTRGSAPYTRGHIWYPWY